MKDCLRNGSSTRGIPRASGDGHQRQAPHAAAGPERRTCGAGVPPILVFLHVQKTAGSTVQFILENSFGPFACHTDHAKRPRFARSDFDFATRLFPGLRSIAGHNLVDPLGLSVPNPFFMTFLREPVSRVFSHYQDSVLSGNRRTFEEDIRGKTYLENLHVKMMAGGRDLDKAKRFLEGCCFVGLFERFELSLRVLERLAPYQLNLGYKRRRVAPNNRLRDALERDGRAVDMAREYNKLDSALYDFAVKEIFPRHCAKAGLSAWQKVGSHERYTTELKWKYLICHFHNMLIYRQICKVRNRFAAEDLSGSGQRPYLSLGHLMRPTSPENIRTMDLPPPMMRPLNPPSRVKLFKLQDVPPYLARSRPFSLRPPPVPQKPLA